MDADEPRRIERRLDRRERLILQILPAVRRRSRRSRPAPRRSRSARPAARAPARRRGSARARAAPSARTRLGQRVDLRIRPPCACAPQALPRARQRLGETLLAERLEQVVDRVHLERAQRVLVVGRREDDRHARGRAARAPRSRSTSASARRGTAGRATARSPPSPPRSRCAHSATTSTPGCAPTDTRAPPPAPAARRPRSPRAAVGHV